jgi:hypothetical protein
MPLPVPLRYALAGDSLLRKKEKYTDVARQNARLRQGHFYRLKPAKLLR